MTPVVVYTDVVSFLFKNDSRAQLYLPLLKNRSLLVSFMTEAELQLLQQWILLAKWGAGRAHRFQEFMRGFASVPSSRGLILRWADAMVAARGSLADRDESVLFENPTNLRARKNPKSTQPEPQPESRRLRCENAG